MRRLGDARAADHVAARGRHEVAEHRGRGLHSPGARAVEHQAPGGLRLEEDRVVRAVDGGERMRERHERRMHPGAHALDAGLGIRQPLADREQLDDEAGLARGDDLLVRDVADSLAVHSLERNRRVEGQAREDRGLLGGVVAADVGGRVGLRVAELGGGGERLLEAVAFAVHAVEDVVGRAVDDAEDAAHPVAREAVAQRSDDRDRAADCRLVVQLGADLLGDREQLGSVGRQERLVAGDDVGAGVEGEGDVLARRLEAAHELDDDVRAEDERVRVGGEQFPRDVGGARRIEVADGDSDELEARADPVGQLVAVLEQERRHLGADRAGSEDGDSQIAVLDHSGSMTVRVLRWFGVAALLV